MYICILIFFIKLYVIIKLKSNIKNNIYNLIYHNSKMIFYYYNNFSQLPNLTNFFGCQNFFYCTIFFYKKIELVYLFFNFLIVPDNSI